MSNSDSSKNTAQKPDGATLKEEQKRIAENVKMFGKLRQNIEAEVLVIIQDLMKKFGQPFTDLLNNLLECSICKGLINSAVSRHRCFHTFCSDCISHWASSSKECPICRDDIHIHVKNPIIDQIVNLLVDFSFTEKEKEV